MESSQARDRERERRIDELLADFDRALDALRQHRDEAALLEKELTQAKVKLAQAEATSRAGVLANLEIDQTYRALRKQAGRELADIDKLSRAEIAAAKQSYADGPDSEQCQYHLDTADSLAQKGLDILQELQTLRKRADDQALQVIANSVNESRARGVVRQVEEKIDHRQRLRWPGVKMRAITRAEMAARYIHSGQNDQGGDTH